MVSSLKANHALLGQTKEQIERLLGTPPATGYFKEYDYVYWLGPERSVFGIDSEWLCLKFENGKVIKAEILTD
jgi:outer membrane protein assembly factor BamE (lipoprotein component of BamABCDE complex)